MKKVFSVLSMLFLFISCNGQPARGAAELGETKGVQLVPPAMYSQKIKETPNPQIIDVRTPVEFSGEHLDGAVNIDWNGDNFEDEVSKLDKSKPVFVYCKIGGRSKQAANKLSEMGFTAIYDLSGGILKWNAEGFAPKSDKIIGVCPQEYAEMLNTDKLVLVDFYAEWCEPCKKMSPYLAKMAEEMKDKVTVIKLNADENKTMVADMKIDSLPALYLYKDKKIVWEHKGFISESALKEHLP